jgi:hypothetical protein
MTVSNRVLVSLGITVALLLWFSGLFSGWVICLLGAVVIIGGLAANLTPSFTRPILIVTGVIVALALGAEAFRSSLFTSEEDRFSFEALGRSKVEADLRWAERIDPHALGARGLLANKCRETEAIVEDELKVRLAAIDANAFLSEAQVKRVHRLITRLQRFRALCREAIEQTVAPKQVARIGSPGALAPAGVPATAGASPAGMPPAGTSLGFWASVGSALTSFWAWIINSALVSFIASVFSNSWSAIPFFTKTSGLLILLSFIFVGVGLVVARYNTAYGSGIAAAGVVMFLTASGDWLAGPTSWFAQLRDVVMGDYTGQPLIVTALKASAIGIVVSAMLGYQPRVKFATVLLAIFLWLVAAVAQPGASLGTVSHDLGLKLGGADISAPLDKIFGGTKTVPCREHDALFRDAEVGQVVRCFQRMNRGDQMVIQLHGGHWGVNPSDAPIRVITWLEGREVYRGAYRSSGIPVSDRVMILAQAPTDLMVNMRKLDSAIKR